MACFPHLSGVLPDRLNNLSISPAWANASRNSQIRGGLGERNLSIQTEIVPLMDALRSAMNDPARPNRVADRAKVLAELGASFFAMDPTIAVAKALAKYAGVLGAELTAFRWFPPGLPVSFFPSWIPPAVCSICHSRRGCDARYHITPHAHVNHVNRRLVIRATTRRAFSTT